ncbi:L-aminoadipate-semialdehyde dehydrogenase protein [Lasiodiplodia theobromae]|uniref:L-aminoadipate-semialdehyde dehydrogenase protein n=1 Tax=Lasiodiplodia theobromae TaxID=45133 RepID=UPI0015C31830|nr:L-aminoadipate-semialdehyde dehydrogenase protein [Lasiodiplodia theobromae]KAF4544629.1 L-aminoadipate-semialdehyde dehydrogenase protein [Lasiodiplodia theobromae]
MGSLPDAEQPCVTLDQVIRRRAETHADQVLISYPANESDFVDYTGADLERLTRLAATRYAGAFAQLDEATRPNGPSSTVALVGVSSLEYYITFLALQRLGLTSMFISPRLADQGFTHLLKSTQCKVIVASGPSQADMQRVRATSGLPLSVIPMLPLSSLDNHQPAKPLPPIDDPDHALRFIIHSGGTTGLPKPVPLLSASWLLQAAKIAGRMPRVPTLSTLPLFHSFGLATLLRCLVNGSRLSLLSASRPITAGAVLTGLAATHSRALVTVPYVLKFLAEVDDGVGIQRLAQLEQVIAAGSAVPDALGDALVVGAGVRLFHLYGLTECGALMEPCSTPASPELWNWVRPLPDAEPYLKFEPVSTSSSSGEGGETLYHLVVLPGLKAKVFADQPDGSYATKDLFRRHPSGANMWKFVARLDDIIVLVNGEKADPVPLEEAVGRNANVRAAVVFGAQRDALGMVVVAADRAAGLSEAEIVQSVLPDLRQGNERVPAYARIAPDALIIKPAGTPFPCTDKATVIRSLFLKQFAKEIDEFYAKREELANGGGAGGDGAAEGVVDDDADIRDLVRQTVRGELRLAEKEGGADLADDSDFFALGMDSLQATNVRSRLLKRVNLGGRTLATNVVFDHPSVELLTAHLLDVRAGQEENGGGPQSAEELAMRLLEKYSTFDEKPTPSTIPNPEKESILLTGATGALGIHILSTLLPNPSIRTIHCLVRAPDTASALSRIHAALSHSHLLSILPSPTLLSKISPIPCDLSSLSASSPSLGLPPAVYAEVAASTTRIIHAAWAVDFNRALRSFDASCLAPTHALLRLAAASPLERKPVVAFVSSIAAALRAGGPAAAAVASSTSSEAASPAPSSPGGSDESDGGDGRAKRTAIPEALHPWSAVAEGMGYGQSKWVAERMCAAAAASASAGVDARVLRVGQLCGDTAHGVWNTAEAIPTTVRAALTVGALPVVENEDGDEELAWLPVDVAARAVVELAFADTAGFRAGLEFEAVPAREWLLEFFRKRKFAPSLRGGTAVDEELVGKFLRFWIEEWSGPAGK